MPIFEGGWVAVWGLLCLSSFFGPANALEASNGHLMSSQFQTIQRKTKRNLLISGYEHGRAQLISGGRGRDGGIAKY